MITVTLETFRWHWMIRCIIDSTDEDPSLQIGSFALKDRKLCDHKLRGVSTKLWPNSGLSKIVGGLKMMHVNCRFEILREI